MLRALREFRDRGHRRPRSRPTSPSSSTPTSSTPSTRRSGSRTRSTSRRSASTARAGAGASTDDDGAEPKVRRDVDVEVNGKRFKVAVWVPETAGAVVAAGAGGPAAAPRPKRAGGGAGAAVGVGSGTVTVPMQGTIVKVLVAVGDTVEVGQAVCVLEAMKMENNIAADKAGTVAEVKRRARPGRRRRRRRRRHHRPHPSNFSRTFLPHHQTEIGAAHERRCARERAKNGADRGGSVDFAPLASLAAGQHGCFAHRQLPDIGLDRQQLRRLHAQGLVLPAEHQGIWRLASHPVTWHQRLMAATLSMPGSMASHRSAAALWGLEGFNSGRIEVVVEHGTWRRRGVTIHQSKDLVAGDRTCGTASRARRWSARSSTSPPSRGRGGAAGARPGSSARPVAVRTGAGPAPRGRPPWAQRHGRCSGRCSNGAASAISWATPASSRRRSTSSADGVPAGSRAPVPGARRRVRRLHRHRLARPDGRRWSATRSRTTSARSRIRATGRGGDASPCSAGTCTSTRTRTSPSGHTVVRELRSALGC